VKLNFGDAQKLKFIGGPAFVFLAFACLFILLRSKDIFAVDGAYRCLDVFHRQRLFFHGNNHMLYPADVLAWARLSSALGFRLDGPFEYFSTIEIMNGLAASGSLTIIYVLLRLVSGSWRLALGATAGYGLSRAFIGQATNANEPMVGIFWSFLAMSFAVMYWQKQKSIWLIAVSGLLFSLAMATYQSTALLAPAAIVLILLPRRDAHLHFGLDSHRLQGSAVFVLSGLAGCVLIYGWSYGHSGTRSVVAMFKRFLVHEDARAYLGVNTGKLLSVPVGLVSDIFPVLSNYLGLRNLFAERKLLAIWLIILIATLGGLLISCVLLVSRNWSRTRPARRVAFQALAVGFAFSLIPVIVWNPLYDKLWIQPLACLTFLLVLAFTAINQDVRIYYSLLRVTAVLLLAGTCSNLVWVVRSHLHEPHELAEAQRLASLVGNRDLLVGEWDQVSTLYGSLWSEDDRFISFPTEAVINGIGVISHLRDAISYTERNGGRVYFLAVLDLPKPNWDAFLGSRCGVPYSEMDLYRAHSSIRATFMTREGEISLRQFDWPLSIDKSR
jgi:hypothetical protein